MPEETILINDNLFVKTLSCPLKFFHITEAHHKRDSSGLLFRQRNKLHVRNAVAHQFQKTRHTSDSVNKASEETENWMNEDSAVICGAVVRHENLLTRIPILVKEGKKLTIIQVHGKLRKKTDGNIIRHSPQNRTVNRYLLKAAYRMDVVQRRYSDYELNVLFCFPNKHFKSSTDNLHLFSEEKFANDTVIKQEFSELFAKAEATKAVQEVHRKIPESVCHKVFENLSVAETIQEILRFQKKPADVPEISRHKGCKYCQFRLPGVKNREGCWDRFFNAESLKHPEKHVFELIGHGNRTESENGSFYQEEAELSIGMESFGKIRKSGNPAITIHQRRNLQILQAKDEPVPAVWVKPAAKIIESLKYPFHFLDFEAATFALPMKRQTGAYSPVFFQFSCHTLFENGELIHTEWLDEQPGEIHPHAEFVNQLRKIPGIFEGTIMQYSPFEKQGINLLIADSSTDPVKYQRQIQILEKIRSSEFPKYDNRFFDMSKVVRDAYYNKYFGDGLSLKQVLSGILQWEQESGEIEVPFLEIGKNVDPYMNIQAPDFLIADGSAAMNAWLALKNGLLTEEERNQIPNILRKYCALDSSALFVIYKHLVQFTSTIESEDFIKFD